MTSDTDTPADKEVVTFEQIPLRIGELMRLTSPEPATPAEHHTVQYIGALPGKGLITTLPVFGGKGLWMPPGTSYVIRVLSGTHVYAFTSQVIRARATPYLHVHFHYPTEVQARKVRQSLRVGMNLTVEIINADGKALPSTLLDLSMHGARLESLLPLEGEHMQLMLPVQLDEAQNRISLKVRIRNQKSIEKAGAGRVVRLGVEFESLEKPDALLLHYFIDHAIAEHGAELL